MFATLLTGSVPFTQILDFLPENFRRLAKFDKKHGRVFPMCVLRLEMQLSELNAAA